MDKSALILLIATLWMVTQQSTAWQLPNEQDHLQSLIPSQTPTKNLRSQVVPRAFPPVRKIIGDLTDDQFERVIRIRERLREKSRVAEIQAAQPDIIQETGHDVEFPLWKNLPGGISEPRTLRSEKYDLKKLASLRQTVARGQNNLRKLIEVTKKKILSGELSKKKIPTFHVQALMKTQHSWTTIKHDVREFHQDDLTREILKEIEALNSRMYWEFSQTIDDMFLGGPTGQAVIDDAKFWKQHFKQLIKTVKRLDDTVDRKYTDWMVSPKKPEVGKPQNKNTNDDSMPSPDDLCNPNV